MNDKNKKNLFSVFYCKTEISVLYLHPFCGFIVLYQIIVITHKLVHNPIQLHPCVLVMAFHVSLLKVHSRGILPLSLTIIVFSARMESKYSSFMIATMRCLLLFSLKSLLFEIIFCCSCSAKVLINMLESR